MNTTPIANRLHIGIFGKRNVGKSSFINALTGQEISIVSPVAGTTTDPVGKTMEIRGIGPVYIYDTAGIDDTGELGEKRVSRTKAVIKKINLAILVTTFAGFDSIDEKLLHELAAHNTRVLVVFNKIDMIGPDQSKVDLLKQNNIPFISVSCLKGDNIDEAKKRIIEIGSTIRVEDETIIGDIIGHGDLVILVVPIDLGAPRGRLILPQVQVIRDILDNNAIAITVKESEIEYVMRSLNQKPALVICDSQVVLKVAGDIPPDVNFTTFSIVFSRLKGELAEFVKGVGQIDKLTDGDKVLICEACTHHSQPDDIGRVKMPRWIRQYTGKDIIFDVNAGPFLDKDISPYKLLIHCGGCMINRQEMLSRIGEAKNCQIPITNYGLAISFVHGVLERALSPFPYERSILK